MQNGVCLFVNYLTDHHKILHTPYQRYRKRATVRQHLHRFSSPRGRSLVLSPSRVGHRVEHIESDALISLK